jgi:hypothetical protein
MKVVLNEAIEIHGKERIAGETVNVKKEDAERMIDEGVAVRVIEVPENRVIGAQENRTVFSNHTRFGRNDA